MLESGLTLELLTQALPHLAEQLRLQERSQGGGQEVVGPSPAIRELLARAAQDNQKLPEAPKRTDDDIITVAVQVRETAAALVTRNHELEELLCAAEARVRAVEKQLREAEARADTAAADSRRATEWVVCFRNLIEESFRAVPVRSAEFSVEPGRK